MASLYIVQLVRDKPLSVPHTQTYGLLTPNDQQVNKQKELTHKGLSLSEGLFSIYARPASYF